MSERCTSLGRAVVDDLSDPFSVVELSLSSLREDGARLDDEARAMSFGGGMRLVRVRGATDVLNGMVGDYLKNPAPGAVVVMDAEELGPRSTLRKTIEGHDRGMAIPCYAAEGRELGGAISAILVELGASADRDALLALSQNLGADRGMVRQELEKLVLFVGENKQITVSDVSSCLVDSVGVSLDQLAFSVADGNSGEADKLLQKAFSEGVSEVAILRALQRHFQRLDWVVSQSDGGSVTSLVNGLRPPVFFKLKDRFERQATRWSRTGLRRALNVLVDAEISCKSSGTPVGLICGRAILALSRPS